MKISLPILLILSVVKLSAQQTDYLVQPEYFTIYADARLIGADTLRVFGYRLSEYNAHGKAFYVDIHADSVADLSTQVIGGNTFSSGHISAVHIMPFINGSTLLALEQFDCDYPPPGELRMINAAGDSVWSLSLEGYFGFLDMRFVTPEVIGVFFLQDTLFVDREGIILDNSFAPTYDHVLEVDNGYVASAANKLYLLDEQFNVLNSHDLEGEVIDLKFASVENIIIKTTQQFYELNNSHSLRDMPFYGFTDMIRTESAYFGIWSLAVLQYDQDQIPRDTVHTKSPGQVEYLDAFELGSEVIFIARYRTNQTHGIVVFREQEDTLNLQLPFDIGITALHVQDTVPATDVDLSFGGYNFSLEGVSAQVSNFGVDTVYNYDIYWFSVNLCAGCYEQPLKWHIDTLPIPPMSSVDVYLGDRYFFCTAIENAEFCLYTDRPNGRADGRQLNDRACPEPFFEIITATHQPPSLTSFVLRPNPASEELRIVSGLAANEPFTVSVFSAHGSLVKQQLLEEANDAIDIAALPEGMYYLQVFDRNGLVGIGKFISQ
jgi:hypothetical protein